MLTLVVYRHSTNVALMHNKLKYRPLSICLYKRVLNEFNGLPHLYRNLDHSSSLR